jgi:hypothetical protein
MVELLHRKVFENLRVHRIKVHILVDQVSLFFDLVLPFNWTLLY